MAEPSTPVSGSAGAVEPEPARASVWSRVLGKLARLFARPRAELCIIALVGLLLTPSLSAGLAADDYIHALILTKSREIPGYAQHSPEQPLDLFRFVTPELSAGLEADGILPWWADPTARFAFFRPLSSATHWLDYTLWPHSPALMHAHNILWALLALVAAAALYRRLLEPRWVAVLAFALYALDDARAPAASWVANRNALVACVFSLWSVMLFVHGMRTPKARWSRWASPAVFAAGLLASEGGISAAAYFLSAALFLDEGPLLRRLSKLLPHAVVGVTWLLAARALGYGVAGSGQYFDPLGDPGDFFSNLPARAAVLLFGQLSGSWSDWWNAYEVVLPGSSRLFLAIAVVACAFFVWLLLPVLKKSATARFFAAGALFSVLPAATAFPGDRMLTWIGIGAFGLLAEFVATYVRGEEERPIGWVVGLVVVTHLVFGPLQIPLRSAALASVGSLLQDADRGVPSSADVRGRTVVYVNPPSDALVCFAPFMRAALGIPRPRAQRALATGTGALKVQRLDARTLSIESKAGYVAAPTERMFRNKNKPFAAGDRFVLPGLAAVVTTVTADRRPAVVRFEFDRALEDPNLVWLVWQGTGYRSFLLPPVGGTVDLPEIDLLSTTMGADHPFVRFFAALRQALGQGQAQHAAR
jgi:hypothetical protein